MGNPWYLIHNLSLADSPALIFYKDRIRENIRRMITMAGGVRRLMPHVKTHKTKEIVEMYIHEGILKFKCATIAEAEMLGKAGAKEVLIAYQPVGPKINRIRKLMEKFSKTAFSVIVDNPESLKQYDKTMSALSVKPEVFIDLNVGMDRTGVKPGKQAEMLFEEGLHCKNIKMVGLHAYDGHIHDSNLAKRETHCHDAFKTVYELKSLLEEKFRIKLRLIAGGTPTFPIHATNPETICSPGTPVLWDYGYMEAFPDLDFLPAALLITRVISKPAGNMVCLDLGYKAVASENPLPRVKFLNVRESLPVSHSEEHLVVQVPERNKIQIGDIFYAIPKHICPTVALYDSAYIVADNQITDSWAVIARNRFISI